MNPHVIIWKYLSAKTRANVGESPHSLLLFLWEAKPRRPQFSPTVYWRFDAVEKHARNRPVQCDRYFPRWTTVSDWNRTSSMVLYWMCIEFQRRVTKRSSICLRALVNNQAGGACVTKRISAFLLLFPTYYLLFLNVTNKKVLVIKVLLLRYVGFFLLLLLSRFPRLAFLAAASWWWFLSPSLPFLFLRLLLYSHFSQCARQIECQIECAQKNEKKNF